MKRKKKVLGVVKGSFKTYKRYIRIYDEENKVLDLFKVT